MEQNQNINYSSKKILLHACCGICSAYPISLLQDMGYTVIVYYYNPNIYPESEYQKRLEAEKTLCNHFNCELIEGKYEPDAYYETVKGLENEPEKGLRCDKCFELRLAKSARIAKEYFSLNFRKNDGFLKTNQISRSLNLYRQNYCGCKFAKPKEN